MPDLPSRVHNLAWRRFLLAHVLLMERIERDLAAAGLPSLAWYDVLYALSEAENQKLRLHELARAVLLSRSTITRQVDRMESAGVVGREQCPGDRRGSFAVLTEDGARLLTSMWKVYGQAIQRYFASHLNEREAKTLIRILTRLARAVDD